MPQPAPYNRLYNFTDWQTVNPNKPLPGNELDGELNAVKLTTDQLRANAALIQRDDGRLANQSVTPESLSAGALALISQGEYTPRGAWAGLTVYAVGDVVDYNLATYLCVVAHTAANAFPSDAGKWLLIANGALSGEEYAVDLFEGDGTTTVFALSVSYVSSQTASVFVNGVAQIPGQDFTISGSSLTFIVAPPAPSVPGNFNVMLRGAAVAAQLAADAAIQSAADSLGHANASAASAAAALASEVAAAASEAAADASYIALTTDANVVAVGTNITSVNTTATNISNVNTVAGISGNVTTVATNNANVTAVAGNATNINAVAGNAANINTVAGNNANVTTVAGVSANVTTVAGISGNVTTVAGISANVTAVAGNSTNINTVAGNNANVTTVAGISANVTSVADNATNINAVAGNATNINTVSGVSANVTTVATSISSVSTVATNIADVNNAQANATAAIAARAGAEVAEVGALAAQAAAELARDQAFAISNVYDTIAAGLAATSNGDYFTVVGTGQTFAALYRNDSGSATFLNTLYAASKVDQIEETQTLTAFLQAAAISQLQARTASPFIFPE